MNNFKTSRELYPYIVNILLAREIPYKVLDYDELRIEVPLSGTKFHKVVQRARCMKKSKETGVFYLTKQEAANLQLASSILQQAGKTSYVILDSEKYKN